MKALFIDFDGTLCHDRYWRSLDPVSRQKIQEFLFGPDAAVVSDWMNGKYNSEEINRIVSEHLEVDYDSLWDIFVNDCKTMKIDEESLTSINILRSQFVPILITDNMDCFDRFTVPSLGLKKYFDVIVNSYTEQRSKNADGGKLFLDVLTKIGIPIQTSTLLDNSATTCEIFRKLGGESFLVTQEKSLSYWLDRVRNRMYH